MSRVYQFDLGRVHSHDALGSYSTNEAHMADVRRARAAADQDEPVRDLSLWGDADVPIAPGARAAIAFSWRDAFSALGGAALVYAVLRILADAVEFYHPVAR